MSKIDTKEAVERIIIPMKTFQEVQKNPIHAEQPTITLSVYPHTGIVADSRSLKTLRETLMHKR